MRSPVEEERRHHRRRHPSQKGAKVRGLQVLLRGDIARALLLKRNESIMKVKNQEKGTQTTAGTMPSQDPGPRR
eukprot:scaffold81523_cov64-Attheya_sp.AAC.7